MFKLIAQDNHKYPFKGMKPLRKVPKLKEVEQEYILKARDLILKEVDQEAIEKIQTYFNIERSR